MDKYEFNIKVEQIKKLVNKRDYATAMKIADTIDWRRVRSANLLALVAEIYENNEEYQEAKEILLLAFERAPIGKRLLYKLAELALKEGSVKEAEDYYREFCDLAPEDPRQYLLRYMILKEKKAPEEQLIHSLERYTDTELDEKWMYELAELYGRVGQQEKCVQTCDRIMLMFGLGKYVDKAMDLKVQYAPLSGYQKDLIENREKYEEKLRAVEQEYGSNPPQEDMEDYEEELEQEPKVRVMRDVEPEEESEGGMEIRMDEEETPRRTIDEELAASIYQAKAEERVAKEMSKISIEECREPEAPAERTKVISDIREILASYSDDVSEDTADLADEEDEKTPEMELQAEPQEEDIREEELSEAEPSLNHLMIEARTPEKGLQMAVEVLKRLHREQGNKNQVIKITGSRLSERGVSASADKLAGKDLVIEEAGDLTEEALDELQDLMVGDQTGITVVLVDNPRQMESLRHMNPGLAGMFTFFGLDGAQEPEGGNEETDYGTAPEYDGESEDESGFEAEDDLDYEAEYEPEYESGKKLFRGKVSKAGAEETEFYEDEFEEEEYRGETSNPDEELELRDFVEYACKYASDIDCSITGKSMLALYERIEIMEEDGIPLTRVNAEDLIEEAADKAEKFSVKKVFTGWFAPKYDKEGLLILREEHFMD